MNLEKLAEAEKKRVKTIANYGADRPFYQYLKDNYSVFDDASGELARWARRDKSFPRKSVSHSYLYNYIEENGDPEMLDAFEEVFEAYKDDCYQMAVEDDDI